eukprot:TRINITY_DN73743_c0_g1_i1.p1 TRINITY_DN73743_c0_g1~~TRINITY_DN73743_c0_g1_i1.p1  ORF type:complete len:515 (-),score=56.58 TRINITY_DN73743_c0_g1_i1:186-1730(-)
MVGNRNLYVAIVYISIGGLLFGFIIGINSFILARGQLRCVHDDIKSDDMSSWGYKQCYHLSSVDIGLISSLNIVGALFSTFFCFLFSGRIGRKLEIQIAASCYLLGGVIAAASPVLLGTQVGLLVYGLGIGFSMHAIPMYIAEIAPPEIRGRLVSAKELANMFGIVLGFFICAPFQSVTYIGWRMMIGVAIIPSAAMLIGIWSIPESPRYLIMRAAHGAGLLGVDAEHLSAARKALCFFRDAGAEEVEEELALLRRGAASITSDRPEKPMDCLKYPKQLVIGCGLVFLQQMTGQPSVLYFARDIFIVAGFGDIAAFILVIIGLAKVLATGVTVTVIDSHGRRTLLFVGIGMMAVALAFLSVAFNFRECKDVDVPIEDCDANNIYMNRKLASCTAVAIMMYCCGYQVGFGPISWTIISEIFPAAVRGAAISSAVFLNYLMNILMTLVEPSLQEVISTAGLFFLFFLLSIFSLLFVWAHVPETKGRTLEQIESDLSSVRRPSIVEARYASRGTVNT